MNPDFANALTVRYYFEKVQNFKFEMVDIDLNGRFDMIGSLEVTMGTLMGSPSQMFQGDLSHNGDSNRGKLIVRTLAINEEPTASAQG